MKHVNPKNIYFCSFTSVLKCENVEDSCESTAANVCPAVWSFIVNIFLNIYLIKPRKTLHTKSFKTEKEGVKSFQNKTSDIAVNISVYGCLCNSWVYPYDTKTGKEFSVSSVSSYELSLKYLPKTASKSDGITQKQ